MVLIEEVKTLYPSEDKHVFRRIDISKSGNCAEIVILSEDRQGGILFFNKEQTKTLIESLQSVYKNLE